MARIFGQGNCLTEDQQQVLGITQDFSCAVLDTCGSEAVLDYPVYDPASSLGYEEGDVVLYPDKQGELIRVLSASENISTPVGALDPTKWSEVCRRKTRDLSYLPGYEILTTRHDFYDNINYSVLDVVLYQTGCSDALCLYVCIADCTGNTSLPPNPDNWVRLYCVPTNLESSCKKIKTCGPGRRVVSLSTSDNDLICVPVESTEGIGPRR